MNKVRGYREPEVVELAQLRSAWVRLGVTLTAPIAEEPVDLEDLIVRTAMVAPYDERLFIAAATWLAGRHHLIDARRLGAAVGQLRGFSSAVAGALLSIAAAEAPGATALEAAKAHARPLRRARLLFVRLAAFPALARLVRGETLAIYRQWGLWHNDATLKPDILRPVRWTLRHCPELRLRALLGSGLDARMVDAIATHPSTVAALAATTHVTYAAAHAAATRLAGRGLIYRPVAGPGRKCWYVTPALVAAVTTFGAQ